MSQIEPQNLINQNREVYNRIAPLFSVARDCIWDDLRPLAEYTKPGDSVLDLGCGNGRLYQILEKKQVQYLGMDQSEELLKIARTKFPAAEFKAGEMSALELPDQKFEAVFCIAALNHIPGPLQTQCLREMYRILKPGGHLLMTNWNLFSESARTKAEANGWLMTPSGEGLDAMVPWKNSAGETLGERYYHGFTPLELETLAHEVGFEIIDQYYSSKGKRVDQTEGGNLVSIFKK